MNRIMRGKVMLASLFILLMKIHLTAQDFNYKFSTATDNYQELNGSKVVSSDPQYLVATNIPIGFKFNFLGKSFDSLRIEPNLTLVFGNDRSYSFSLFNMFITPGVDTLPIQPSISYQVKSNGSKQILKLQFKQCAFDNGKEIGYANFQIWLYEENGKIEYRFGTNKFTADRIQNIRFISGPYNALYNYANPPAGSIYGQLINGSAASPVLSNLNTVQDIKYVIGYPVANTVYVYSKI